MESYIKYGFGALAINNEHISLMSIFKYSVQRIPLVVAVILKYVTFVM